MSNYYQLAAMATQQHHSRLAEAEAFRRAKLARSGRLTGGSRLARRWPLRWVVRPVAT